jgi:RNA polymerase primary sigma factor
MSRIDEQIIENVTNQAHRFGSKVGLDGEAIADMTQECLVDIIENEGAYDESLAAFGTWAYRRADTVMRNWTTAREHTVVPVPRRLGELLARARAATITLEQRLLRAPTHQEIADELGITLETYEKARVKGEYERADGGGMPGDPLFDPEAENFEDTVDGSGVIPDPEHVVEVAELVDLMEYELGRLTEPEAAVLALVFGLRDNHQHTLREAGEALSLSHEHVRRIRDRGLAKLRARLPGALAGADIQLDGRDNA